MSMYMYITHYRKHGCFCTNVRLYHPLYHPANSQTMQCEMVFQGVGGGAILLYLPVIHPCTCTCTCTYTCNIHLKVMHILEIQHTLREQSSFTTMLLGFKSYIECGNKQARLTTALWRTFTMYIVDVHVYVHYSVYYTWCTKKSTPHIETMETYRNRKHAMYMYMQ